MLRKFMLNLILSLWVAPICMASQSPTTLIVKPIIIEVNGQATQIYTIQQADGTWGYVGTEGDEFDIVVENKTAVPTSIHWHGLILPNDQDGIPYVTQEPIAPGAHYPYHFKLVQSGTYWMHSHYKFQMQQGMFAPLIIKDRQDPYQGAKDVVMLISDFSFKSPEEINDSLIHPKMHMNKNHSLHSMHKMSMNMKVNKADLNDVHYDTYLTNYHDLKRPEIVTVAPGQKIRLRVIDAGSASSFFINLGNLKGTVIAVDGEAIKPIEGSRFSISEGQRLDILISLPNSPKSAYSIFAEAEGTNQRTGLILSTPEAKIPVLSETVKKAFGAINELQDLQFHALHPLDAKSISKKITLSLEGSMSPYIWKINNQVWPNITPIKVKKGDRIEMLIINKTNMSHPIHLHGHVFEVSSINGKKLADGPLRDTVLVPAQGTVSIVLDADNSGNWMLHCHVLYHAENGMMSIMQYEGMPNPDLSIM